jgi:hypothetical protein
VRHPLLRNYPTLAQSPQRAGLAGAPKKLANVGHQSAIIFRPVTFFCPKSNSLAGVSRNTPCECHGDRSEAEWSYPLFSAAETKGGSTSLAMTV